MTRQALATAIVSIAALLSMTTMADAFTAETSPGGEITMTSGGRMTFVFGGITIECALTLRGSLARSVTVTTGESLGRISAVSASECVGAEWERFLNLPWDIHYDGTAGTLPNSVTAVNFTIMAFSWQMGRSSAPAVASARPLPK